MYECRTIRYCQLAIGTYTYTPHIYALLKLRMFVCNLTVFQVHVYDVFYNINARKQYQHKLQ